MAAKKTNGYTPVDEIKHRFKLKQAKNNSIVYGAPNDLDMSKEEIFKLYNSPLLRQHGIGYVRVKTVYGSHISFIPRGDSHLANSDPKANRMTNKYIKDTMTYFFDGGDMLQMSTEGHHPGEAQEAKITGKEETRMFKSDIAPIADKCLCATAGNHDAAEQAARLKAVGIDTLEGIYTDLNIYYAPTGVIMEFITPVMKNSKKVGEASFVVVNLHCGGKTAPKQLDSAYKTYSQGMGLIDKFNRIYGTHLVPNMIAGNHFHAASDLDISSEQNIYDENGRVTGTYNHTTLVRNNSTLQHGDTSSFNRMFSNQMYKTYKQYDVSFEPNPNFNPNGSNKRPQFIPVVTEFPILTRDGELTTMAKEYSEKRRDLSQIEIEEIKKSHKNSKLDDVYKSFIESTNSL